MTRSVPVSPDGERYLAMARGQLQPRPFAFRWLAPRVLGDNTGRWQVAAHVSFAAIAAAGALYCRSWAALAVPLGLAGLTVQVRAPVLVDLHAMALALCAALAWQAGVWPAAIVLALAAGATKETAPLFAAAYAWSPVPLAGMLAPAIRWLVIRKREVHDIFPSGPCHDALANPFRTAWNVHKAQPFHWWILPLGVLVVGLCVPTVQSAVVVGLAYGQCVMATDLVRLYTWAWPTLAARTFDVLPSRWWLLAVVVHLCSPHKGEGW